MITKLHHKDFIIDHYLSLQSTNSLALELIKTHQINHNQIILADSQTGGKGRMGRNWSSPIGNLYFSLVLKLKNPSSMQLSFVASAAMSAAIAGFATSGSETKINHKWPNDILIDGKKVAGILLEKDADFVVIGIGVNINSYPTNISYPASDLISQGFRAQDKIELLKNFLDHFENLYQKWSDFGFAPIRNLWLTRAYNLQKEINVNLPNQSLKGIFKDLDKDGNLILNVDGKEILIASGEIF